MPKPLSYYPRTSDFFLKMKWTDWLKFCEIEKSNFATCNSEMFRGYEDVLFRHCLRHGFDQLRSVLPNPTLARFLHYIAIKKDTLINGNHKISIRRWSNDILKNWLEIISTSKPRLCIHICKELSIFSGTGLSQSQELKKWFLDLLQQPVRQVDLKTRLSLLDLTYVVLSKVNFEIL